MQNRKYFLSIRLSDLIDVVNLFFWIIYGEIENKSTNITGTCRLPSRNSLPLGHLRVC